MIHRALAATLSLLSFASCVTSTVDIKFDPTTDFGSFHTFAFLAPDPFIAAPSGMDEVILPRIVAATQEALESTGLVLSDDMDATDLIVSFSLGAREDSKMSRYPAYYGRSAFGNGSYGWGYPYLGQVSVKHYTEGTLAIDIVDRQKAAPIWHGRKLKTITEKMRKKPGQAVADAVTEILEGFPPAPAN
jgi:hypothetical protein